MWITNEVCIQGRGHMDSGTPCQDKTYCMENKKISVISLADGAGSKKLSHFGAEVCCVTVCRFFEEYAQKLYECKNVGEYKPVVYDMLMAELGKTAKLHDCGSIGELGSTLLAVAVYRDKMFFLHIGDGLIAYRKNGNLIPLSLPDNGEYINQTTFVTSSDAFEHMRMKSADITEGVDAFFIMSDGSSSSFYNPAEKRISVSLNSFVDMSMIYSQEKIHEELVDFFENVMRKRTLDDCSLSFLVRKQEEKCAERKYPAVSRKIIQCLAKNKEFPLYRLPRYLHVRKANMHIIMNVVDELERNGCLEIRDGKIISVN